VDRKEATDPSPPVVKRKAEDETNDSDKKSKADTAENKIESKHVEETKNLCTETDYLLKLDNNEVKIKLESTDNIETNSKEISDCEPKQNIPDLDFVELYKSFGQVKESLDQMNTISDQISYKTGESYDPNYATLGQIENNEVMDIQKQLLQMQDFSSDEDEDDDRMQEFVDEEDPVNVEESDTTNADIDD
jgi:hypothetical protein